MYILKNLAPSEQNLVNRCNSICEMSLGECFQACEGDTTWHQHPEVVTNIEILPPTSQNRHQHHCHPQRVTLRKLLMLQNKFESDERLILSLMEMFSKGIPNIDEVQLKNNYPSDNEKPNKKNTQSMIHLF